MASNNKSRRLMEKYGKTFSEEINIHPEKNTPAALFQLLVSSMLFSARIGSDIAENAAKNLFKQGWTSPEKMLNTTWNQRVKVLNEAHYTRYQEKTATFLEDIAKDLQEKYKGDLNNLRKKGDKDPEKIRELLKEFKGMGGVGVDIFFRKCKPHGKNCTRIWIIKQRRPLKNQAFQKAQKS